MLQKIFHIVYLTLNTINGKIYVGKHSSKHLHDKYLGSGTTLKKDIKFFGVEHFKRFNLYVFETEKEAFDYERNIVDEEFIKIEDVYNNVPGGNDGIFNTTGYINVIDKDSGNNKIFRVRLDNPYYISGKYISANTGRKGKPWDDERRRKAKETKLKNGTWAKVHDKETREKISNVKKKMKLKNSEESKRKCYETKLKNGTLPGSDCVVAKTRETLKAQDPEKMHARKIKEWNTKMKNGTTLKGKPKTKEHIANMIRTRKTKELIIFILAQCYFVTDLLLEYMLNRMIEES